VRKGEMVRGVTRSFGGYKILLLSWEFQLTYQNYSSRRSAVVWDTGYGLDRPPFESR